MAGLLDALNSDEGMQAIGLLAAAGPSATPMSFGQRLFGAMQQDQSRRTEAEDRKMKQQMQQLQMQQLLMQAAQAKRAAERQNAMEALPGRFMQPGMKPETMDNRDVGMPGEAPIPKTQFDLGGYANELFRYDPHTALQLKASMQKDNKRTTLKPGEAVFDEGGKQLFGLPDKAPDPTSDIKNYAEAVKQGFKGSLLDYQSALRRAGAASVQVAYGAPVAGQDANGNPVFFQPSKDGAPPSIVKGVSPPAKEMPAAMAEKFAQNSVTLDKIDKALSLVQTRPQSLGAKNYLPDAVVQRMDPAGTDVRALVADIGGQKIHDRSGAAVTVGESERLKPYIPAATDTPDAAVKKLRLFRQEYAAMQRALASGASIKQAAQSGGSAPPIVNFSDLK